MEGHASLIDYHITLGLKGKVHNPTSPDDEGKTMHTTDRIYCDVPQGPAYQVLLMPAPINAPSVIGATGKTLK